MQIFWMWDIKLQEKMPEKGMNVKNFIPALEEFTIKCSKNIQNVNNDSQKKSIKLIKERAEFLLEDTIRSELMPSMPKNIKESYVKNKEGKLIPLSDIRKMNGTML